MFRSDARRFVVSKAARAREREVGPFVRVQGQAQPAFQPAEVVPEDVRIFREVDRLECELPEPFSPIDRLLIRTSDATAVEFTANAILNRPGEGVSRGRPGISNTSRVLLVPRLVKWPLWFGKAGENRSSFGTVVCAKKGTASRA